MFDINRLGCHYGSQWEERVGLGVMMACVHLGLSRRETVRVLNNLYVENRHGKRWTPPGIVRAYERIKQLVMRGM